MDELNAKLFELGIHLKSAFITEVTRLVGTLTAPVEERTQHIISHFLTADMNICGSGCLPANLSTEHNTVLTGRHVLQVDEAVDVAACAKQRYDGAGGRRCLKLSLTDGQRRAFAFEQTPIAALKTLCPAGLKVAITDVPIKRGMLVLRPENISVMGGEVERLEQARQRMIERWRQPPACSSGRNGATVNLFAAASAAAWPEQNNNVAPAAPTQRVDRQQAARPSGNPRIHPAHNPHPIPEPSSGDEGTGAARHAPAGQHSAGRDMGRGASDGLRQQAGGDGEPEVIEVSDGDDEPAAAAASKSSLDSWDDQAAALARQGRNRLKRKAPTQLVDDDDDELDSPSHEPPQSRLQARRVDEPGSAEATRDMRQTPGPLTSLSQLENLKDEDYPASITMHGSIVGLASKLQFMVEGTQVPLDSWFMELGVEDSTSGSGKIVGVSDALINEILGMSAQQAYSHAVQGRGDLVRQKYSEMKEVVMDFVGYMVLEIPSANEKPILLSLESTQIVPPEASQ